MNEMVTTSLQVGTSSPQNPLTAHPFPLLSLLSHHVIPSVAEESRLPTTRPPQNPQSTPNPKSFEGVRGNFYKSSPAVPPLHPLSNPRRHPGSDRPAAAGRPPKIHPSPRPPLTRRILTPRRRPPGHRPSPGSTAAPSRPSPPAPEHRSIPICPQLVPG